MHSLDAYDTANCLERDLLLSRLARRTCLDRPTSRERADGAPFPPRRRAWWAIRTRPVAG